MTFETISRWPLSSEIAFLMDLGLHRHRVARTPIMSREETTAAYRGYIEGLQYRNGMSDQDRLKLIAFCHERIRDLESQIV